MAKRENQRILLTKRMLQEGLLQLLETKSLDAISVTELCRASGINRATFYNHFTSPLNLLNSIEEKTVEDLTQIIRNPRTPNEVLAHVEGVCEYFYQNAKTMLALHNCHADTQIAETLYMVNQDFQLYRLNEKFARYAPNTQQEGLHLISTFFYTGCYHMLLEWLKNGIPASPKEIANLMVTLARDNFLE